MLIPIKISKRNLLPTPKQLFGFSQLVLVKFYIHSCSIWARTTEQFDLKTFILWPSFPRWQNVDFACLIIHGVIEVGFIPLPILIFLIALINTCFSDRTRNKGHLHDGVP